MNVIDQAKAILNTFRASKSLARVHEYGIDNVRPTTTNYESLYSTSATVYACIRLRADSVARPPTRLYSRKNGTSAEVLDHPLTTLLRQVNPFWTRQQLIRGIETDLGWHGNAFVAVERDRTGKPIELWRMRPDWIEVVPDGKQYLKGYIYTVEGESYKWTVDDVIHFRYMNPLNEYWGLSPLSAARMSADLGIDAITYDRNFFLNVAAPAVALQTKEQMAKPQADEILKRWEQAFKGVKAAGRTVVLHSGLEVKPIALSQKDSEWIGAMKWAVDDIARVFRVPTPLIGEEKAVYRNIAEAEASFWHQAIIPELLWIEEILNAELVPLFGDPTLRIGFDLSDVEQLQDDVTSRITRYQQLVDRGIITINEMRRRENLGKDLPWGDKWFAPMNLAPIAKSELGNSFENIRLLSEPVIYTELLEAPDPLRIDTTQPDIRTNDLPDQDDDILGENIDPEIVEILAAFLKAESEKIAAAYSKDFQEYAADYDWAAWKALSGPLQPPLVRMLEESAVIAYAEIKPGETPTLKLLRAQQWAESRVAELIVEVSDITKKVVKILVRQGVAEGWARDKLAGEIRKHAAFSKDRAVLVARTESQRAYNEGLYRGYKQTHIVDKKIWLNMGSGDVCFDCITNAASDPIPLNASFPSMHDAPPAHPNCRCRLMPYISEGGI